MSMIPVSGFDRLPNVVLVHVIEFENDRLVWARLCKKAHKCWQEAGKLAIKKNLSHFSMLEYVARKGITPWNHTFAGIDPFLRSFVENLFPRQTLLPGRREIRDQLYTRDLRYRDAAHLNSLHTQATNASDRQLVAFARWLCEQSPSAKIVLEGFLDSKPLDVQADFVARLLNAHGHMIHVGAAAVLNVENLEAVPKEILRLNVPENVLQRCLYNSVEKGQLPLVAAFLSSPKKDLVDFYLSVIASTRNGDIDLLHMFVAAGLTLEGYNDLIYVLSKQFDNLPEKKRLKILQLFLTSHHNPKNLRLEKALEIAATFGEISWKERLQLVNLVLFDPRIDGQALSHVFRLISGDHDEIPGHYQLMRLFRLFLRREDLPPGCVGTALKDVLLKKPRTLQERLELAEILLADPRVTPTEFRWVFDTILRSNELQPSDRLAIFQLLVNDPRFTFNDLMDGLKKCCEKGWVEEARLLLADPRHTADTLKKAIGAFTDAARRGPCEEDCFAVARLLLAHPLFSPESRDYLLLRIIGGYFMSQLELPQRQLRFELFREMIQQKRVSPITLYRVGFNVVRNVADQNDFREMIRVLLAEPETPSDALAGGVRAALSERYGGYEKTKLLLTAEGATPAMLSACLPKLVSSPELTHPEYQEALFLLASHPNARFMPLIVRTWLVFERIVAFLKTPFRALGNWKFSNHTSAILSGILFFPATLVQFVALQIWERTHPSR